MLPQSLLISVAALAASVSASAIPNVNARTTCTNPVVRKEWRELTSTEKADYIKAAQCIRALPKSAYTDVQSVTSRMDDLTWTHNALNNDIHFVANFLPWHRWFVQLHEHILQTECGYKGVMPYWDWTIDADAKSMPTSPIFDPVTGFGGNGRKTTTPDKEGFVRCVMEGPFANTTVTLGMGFPNNNVKEHEAHCFTRAFNNASGNDENGDLIIGDMQVSAYNSDVIKTISNFDNFHRMADMLEGLPHAQIHSVIFGDMGPATSPTEPLFMLHHAQVDRVWAKWQGRNDTRLADYTGFKDQDMTIRADINDEMPAMRLSDTAPIVKDYMDTLAGPLCYTYSNM